MCQKIPRVTRIKKRNDQYTNNEKTRIDKLIKAQTTHNKLFISNLIKTQKNIKKKRAEICNN